MADDVELLGRFCADGSESAFSEIADRYLGLVYSVAFRQVRGDEHLARDVCQEVFAALARKARRLKRGVILAGWLYRSALFEARGLMRSKRRRRIRELETRRISEAIVNFEADNGRSPENAAELEPLLEEESDLEHLPEVFEAIRTSVEFEPRNEEGDDL